MRQKTFAHTASPTLTYAFALLLVIAVPKGAMAQSLHLVLPSVQNGNVSKELGLPNMNLARTKEAEIGDIDADRCPDLLDNNLVSDPQLRQDTEKRTPASEPGENFEFEFRSAPGRNCFDSDCMVCVMVDFKASVIESDENNNLFCTSGGDDMRPESVFRMIKITGDLIC